eukprot:TRINITY_DN10043_c0_g1_i2.p1 TRINITY_DN10043_c0_g1~~TRINITY_DN10043_c0_g1_i2.p1  ORF type:complete len:762 (+),score=70.51 TRINITY_DN10043_c0_g1_i2:938-3223(+)
MGFPDSELMAAGYAEYEEPVGHTISTHKNSIPIGDEAGGASAPSRPRAHSRQSLSKTSGTPGVTHPVEDRHYMMETESFTHHKLDGTSNVDSVNDLQRASLQSVQGKHFLADTESSSHHRKSKGRDSSTNPLQQRHSKRSVDGKHFMLETESSAQHRVTADARIRTSSQDSTGSFGEDQLETDPHVPRVARGHRASTMDFGYRHSQELDVSGSAAGRRASVPTARSGSKDGAPASVAQKQSSSRGGSIVGSAPHEPHGSRSSAILRAPVPSASAQHRSDSRKNPAGNDSMAPAIVITPSEARLSGSSHAGGAGTSTSGRIDAAAPAVDSVSGDSKHFRVKQSNGDVPRGKRDSVDTVLFRNSLVDVPARRHSRQGLPRESKSSLASLLQDANLLDNKSDKQLSRSPSPFGRDPASARDNPEGKSSAGAGTTTARSANTPSDTDNTRTSVIGQAGTTATSETRLHTARQAGESSLSTARRASENVAAISSMPSSGSKQGDSVHERGGSGAHASRRASVPSRQSSKQPDPVNAAASSKADEVAIDVASQAATAPPPIVVTPAPSTPAATAASASADASSEISSPPPSPGGKAKAKNKARARQHRGTIIASASGSPLPRRSSAAGPVPGSPSAQPETRPGPGSYSPRENAEGGHHVPAAGFGRSDRGLLPPSNQSSPRSPSPNRLQPVQGRRRSSARPAAPGSADVEATAAPAFRGVAAGVHSAPPPPAAAARSSAGPGSPESSDFESSEATTSEEEGDAEETF